MTDRQFFPIKRIIVGIVFTILALTILWGSWYTIDQGERGVILRNGAVIGTADAGLGFKVPMIDSVVRISVQSSARTYQGLMAYSKDQQTATMTVSVNYNLPADQVEAIYSQYGGEEGVINRVLDRQLNKSLEEVFGRFNAVTAIQDRARLGLELQQAIQNAVVGPIAVTSIQIESIDFSTAYETSIEQRMVAEVDVQKVTQIAEKEKVQAGITVIKAQADADAKLADAKAQAEATRLQGEAEATAIRAKGAALADNPTLVALIQAERWDGKLPTTMIPDSTVPFMDMVK